MISIDSLVLSKSLALLEKTRRRVEQIDTTAFPTESSERPRNLLLSAIKSLADQKHWSAMSAESLYNALIRLQDLVGSVEASTSENISWPLVSYCDHFWELLFPNGDVSIFYSVFKEHNFSISSFSARLRSLLETLLPPNEIDAIIGSDIVYCLQISSLETENLPLYANVGHEFGHALYWLHEKRILKILDEETRAIFATMAADLKLSGSATAIKRSALLIIRVGMELFCDLVGTLVAGPAFLLSLHEMGWGGNQTTWHLSLSPKDFETRAYPSFAFRLAVIKNSLPIDSFTTSFERKLKDTLGTGHPLTQLHSCIADISINHAADVISIVPMVDRDAPTIKTVFEKNLLQLKIVFEKALGRFQGEVLNTLAQNAEFNAVSEHDIFDLISRLEADILPNIIPNQTLLGKPATFRAILNACALYRMHMLMTRLPAEGSEEISHRLSKVDRLTAKALEVSYIQHDFNRWATP